MTEHDIYLQIAQYLRLRYPNVIYRYDLAADLKLSIGQAKKHKALQHYRGYPDLFIAEPRGKYHGLFIEIKKDGTRIFTNKGPLVADAHIREQFDMLADLRQRGYQAQFGIGLDNVKQLIDEYLA